MTSTEVVGPLPVVYFNGGPHAFDQPREVRPKVAYQPPRDTLDPRYATCTDHHVACDCREAEWAEERREAAFAAQERREAFNEILAGHPTWQWSDDGNELTGCMCTGCRIARACHIWPATQQHRANEHEDIRP
jgi:hypothetical protein